MNDYIVNGKNIKFSNNDFLAKGGQGSVYVKGSTVFKVYTNISEMITRDKISELQNITDRRVIVPKDMIFDKNNNEVGFTMSYTKDTIPLIKLFNTGFREKINFDEKDTLKLIEQMQYVIQHIHDNNVLQIDGNELNYLVGDNFKTPYFIDVDSYQTKSHKATVLMPSIRDWQANKFTTLTDWYSFGIVACQLFIGLHPYKGRHNDYNRDLKQRALDNISIFNKDVRVPKAVRDFSNIPSEYMNWFVELFEQGKRVPPPLVAGTMVIKPTVTVVVGSNLIKVKEIKRTKKYIDSVLTPYKKEELRVSIKDQKLFIENDNITVNCNLFCNEYMISNNNIYAKYGNKLNEVILNEFNDNVIVKYNSWSISPNSSKLMDGFVYQSLLGNAFLTIPYSSGLMANIALPELDDYKIIDGKYENKVSMLIGLNNKTLKYDRITLIFNKNHDQYVISVKEDVDYYLNFTVLEVGVVLDIHKDGEISVFLNDLDNDKRKEIKDSIISTDWKLTHEGSKAMFYKDKSLFQLKMI